MELVTAVLAGNNTLELRLFSGVSLECHRELVLNRRLCRLMDLFHEDWRR